MKLKEKNGNVMKGKISLVTILLLTMVFTTTALAAYITLSVTNVSQAKSNWCWAACIEMSATTLGYSDYDQWDIIQMENVQAVMRM